MTGSSTSAPTTRSSGSTTSSRRGSRASSGDAVFLQLGLPLWRAKILEALSARAWAKSEHLELPVTFLPGVTRVAMFCWPEPFGRPERVLVDIVRVDAQVLEAPIGLVVPLVGSERPDVADELPVVVATFDDEDSVDRARCVVLAGPAGPVTWRLVGRAGYEKEVERLDAGGRPVLGLVDTTKACYRMTCGCGRVRYAAPNSLHQVFWCRVCTRAQRLRKRALTQYRARYGKPR